MAEEKKYRLRVPDPENGTVMEGFYTKRELNDLFDGAAKNFKKLPKKEQRRLRRERASLPPLSMEFVHRGSEHPFTHPGFVAEMGDKYAGECDLSTSSGSGGGSTVVTYHPKALP